MTSFEYQLHSVPQVLAGPVLHPFPEAARVLNFYSEFSRDIPDELNTIGALLHTPEGHPVTGIVCCWNGPFDTGERFLRPVREFGPPLVDEIQPMPYSALQTSLDEALAPGRRYYSKGHLIGDATEDAVATIVDFYARVPSPGCFALLQQLGNASNRVDPAATAFSHRHARYEFVILAGWDDAGDDERHVSWVREFYDAMTPYALGLYVNSIVDDDKSLVEAAYGPKTFDRLSSLKAKYDPTNFFRLNANIPPSV